MVKYGIFEQNAAERRAQPYWQEIMEGHIIDLKSKVSFLKKQYQILYDKVQRTTLSGSPSSEYTPLCSGRNKDVAMRCTCTDNAKIETNIAYEDGKEVRYNCKCYNLSFEELRLMDYARGEHLTAALSSDQKLFQNKRRTSNARTSKHVFINGKAVRKKYIGGNSFVLLPAGLENVPHNTEDFSGIRQNDCYRLQRVQPVSPASKHEELLSQVVSELKNLNSNFSKVDSRLSTVESNLANMSAQVSVVNSRLSAVDMFVTMERFDKKWQALKPMLASLESTPCKGDGGMTSFQENNCFQISKSEGNFETPTRKWGLNSNSSSTPVKDCEFSLNNEACMSLSTETSTCAIESQLNSLNESISRMDFSDLSLNKGSVSNIDNEKETSGRKNVDFIKHNSFKIENCKESKNVKSSQSSCDENKSVLKMSNLCDVSENNTSSEKDLCEVMPISGVGNKCVLQCARAVELVEQVQVVVDDDSPSCIEDLSCKPVGFTETNNCSLSKNKNEITPKKDDGLSHKPATISEGIESELVELRPISPDLRASGLFEMFKDIIEPVKKEPIVKLEKTPKVFEANEKPPINKDTCSDDETEYVIVQSKDVDGCESLKESELTTNLKSFSFSKNLLECANTTEYLEVNCRRNYPLMEIGTKALPDKKEEIKIESKKTEQDSEKTELDESSEVQSEGPVCVDEGAVTTASNIKTTKENKSSIVNDDSFVSFMSGFKFKSAGQQSSPFTFDAIQDNQKSDESTVVKPVAPFRAVRKVRRLKSTSETITTNMSGV